MGQEFTLLLIVFEYGAPLFGLIFKRFTRMRNEEQDRYLASWRQSGIPFKRMGFQALKRIALTAYYASEESWTGIGYAGPWLSRGYPHSYQGHGIVNLR